MKGQTDISNVKAVKIPEQKKRGQYFDVLDIIKNLPYKLSKEDSEFFTKLDVLYRTLAPILYNYVPMSGHPGGSISSGRIVQSLLFNQMDYDFSDPDRKDADMISYAAGHKAMGLYAIWALRNELCRVGDSSLLADEQNQLRLEDLLGFRRNPTNETPLFKKFKSKALDGHPCPIAPFVKLSTGASGVGVGSSFGLALGAMDFYAENPPKVHVIEGEGGMTAGRVHEAIAAAATIGLSNIIMHLDWNQASIDSNHVCAENAKPGDYVQWTPAEIFKTHDWNVIYVHDGHNFEQVFAAQEFAKNLNNGQPTAIVYRTTKGWKYGIEGKASHGAGHKFASEEFYSALAEFKEITGMEIPRFCGGDKTPDAIETCFWNNLLTFRKFIENDKTFSSVAAKKLKSAKTRLDSLKREQRADAPKIEKIVNKKYDPANPPEELKLKHGESITLRGVLGDILGYLNRESQGAFLATSADLAGSTSLSNIGKGFGEGFYNAKNNHKSRIVPIGGICEDAMGAVMTGVSGYGAHIGVTSSYAAFIAALEHIAARLHAIGQQTKKHRNGDDYTPFIMINAHAGVKTGEDGPTHADPQPLQLLQENFPKGTAITLTPWDPQEIWPLMVTALAKRPAIIAPFVTRPAETVLDRKFLGLAPATDTVKGMYALVKADNSKPRHGTIVLQGNGVATIFINEVLPELKRKDLNINVFYVSSAELFRLLPESEQNSIFPEELANEAMGITDFTLPTMYCWIRSQNGIKRTLYPFQKGMYLGSGQAHKVLEEAGVHAESQIKAILEYVKSVENKTLATK
jgi:transketolase